MLAHHAPPSLLLTNGFRPRWYTRFSPTSGAPKRRCVTRAPRRGARVSRSGEVGTQNRGGNLPADGVAMKRANEPALLGGSAARWLRGFREQRLRAGWLPRVPLWAWAIPVLLGGALLLLGHAA